VFRIAFQRAGVAMAGFLLLAACASHNQASSNIPAVEQAQTSAALPQSPLTRSLDMQPPVAQLQAAQAASLVSPVGPSFATDLDDATENSGFRAIGVTFTYSLIGDNGFLIADFAKRYGVRTVFLPVNFRDAGNLLARNPTTVANLNALFACCHVYMLTGDETWLEQPKVVPGVAYVLSQRIGPMYPNFAGILYDVEPQEYPEWNTNRQATIERYFTLLDTLFLRPVPRAYGRTLVSTIPAYARQPNRSGGQSPSMLQAIENYRSIDATYLRMAGDSASGQLQAATPAFPQLTKPYWAVSSTSPHGGSNSYAGATPAYFGQNMRALTRGARANNAHLLAVAVDSWDDRDTDLQAILPQPTPSPIPEPTGKLVPPDGTDYIGAYVSPEGAPADPATVAAFEKQIGRTLGYDIHYYGWDSTFPGNNEADDEAHDRIPLVSWKCGDSNARIAAGDDDSLIKARADAFRAFGHPVFLRYQWEMNLYADTKAHAACYDPKTDLPTGYYSAKHFVAAWQRMYGIFKKEGANKVVWLWNPGGGGPDPTQYYPDDAYVDWVGIDEYDRHSVSFEDTFLPDLDDFTQFRKPLIVVETGALADFQKQFFETSEASIRNRFPLLRGFSYLDAHSGTDWSLTTEGVAGFKALAHSHLMSARQPR
jgi:hypothetical protein